MKVPLSPVVTYCHSQKYWVTSVEFWVTRGDSYFATVRFVGVFIWHVREIETKLDILCDMLSLAVNLADSTGSNVECRLSVLLFR